MTQDEIGQVASWAVNISDEYGVTITKCIQLYKAIRKNFGMIETMNQIEHGFLLIRGPRIGEDET